MPTVYITTPCPCCGQATRQLNGLWLRDLRKAAGLTQRAFGKRHKVSSSYISDIERNRRTCPDTIAADYRSLERG